MKPLLKLAIGAILLGAVTGVILFGLLAAFEPAFEALKNGSVRTSRGPGALFLIVGLITGRAGVWLIDRTSGMSGMIVVAPLAFLCAISAAATGYLLAIQHTHLPSPAIAAILLLPTLAIIGTACFMQWLDS